MFWEFFCFFLIIGIINYIKTEIKLLNNINRDSCFKELLINNSSKSEKKEKKNKIRKLVKYELKKYLMKKKNEDINYLAYNKIYKEIKKYIKNIDTDIYSNKLYFDYLEDKFNKYSIVVDMDYINCELNIYVNDDILLFSNINSFIFMFNEGHILYKKVNSDLKLNPSDLY